MRRKFLIFVVVAVLLASAALFYGTRGKTSAAGVNKSSEGPIPVDIAQIRVDTATTAHPTVATLMPDESVMLKPEIAGRIAAIKLPEGTSATKGQLLIQMDDRIAAAELTQAEAALALARASYDRAKMLKDKGVGTVSHFDTMRATLAVAQAQVDLSRVKLDQMRILAPFDGVMGLRYASPGDYVTIGQTLAGFTKNNPMKVEFSLPESMIPEVAVGQTVMLTIDALAGKKVNGRIYAIDPQINTTSRNITLRALIPNDDGALRAGLFARLSVITSEQQGSLFIPESAIVPRGNEVFVMRLDEHDKATTVPVILGERRDGEVRVISGLSASDRVIIGGQLKVKDGQQVHKAAQ